MEEDKKIKKRYNRVAPIYDSLEWLMEKAKMGEWRKNFWNKIKDRLPLDNGKLLEAGVGTGKNIKYYPDNIDIYAIDFSENMINESKIKLNKYNKEAKLLEGGVGTGKNIKYYPENIEIYAIDFSENMINESKIKLDKYNK